MAEKQTRGDQHRNLTSYDGYRENHCLFSKKYLASRRPQTVFIGSDVVVLDYRIQRQ